ncbi:unnamed protein product [Paramecium octaurelia]|uniref:Uncharacterized protein n=1 Tax=Paramecium octaurelia TaxID=43137 RepID=A0A8S1W1D3_PAROT|nr:unnamed protein product [Paramecium octaurelia]
MKIQDPFNRSYSNQISNDPFSILKSSHIPPNRNSQRNYCQYELQGQHTYFMQYYRKSNLCKCLDLVQNMTHIKDYKKTHILKMTIFENSNGYSPPQFRQFLLCYNNLSPYFQISINRVDISDYPLFQITLTVTVDDEESEIGKSQYISKMTQTFQTETGIDFKIKSLELSSTICYSPLVLQVAISTPLSIQPSQVSVRV